MNSRFLLALVVVLTSFSFLNAQPSRIMKSLESLEVEIGSQLSVQEIDEVNKSLSTRLKRRQSTIAVKKSISGFFASLFTLGASVAVIDYALGDYMLMTKQFIDWSYLELLTKNVSSSGFLIDGYTAYSAAKYFQEVGTVFDERTAAKLLKKIKTSEELVVKELKKEF